MSANASAAAATSSTLSPKGTERSAIERGAFEKAFLVLGGEGWTLREFYTSGALTNYIRAAEKIEIVTLEAFVARANRAKL